MSQPFAAERRRWLTSIFPREAPAAGSGQPSMRLNAARGFASVQDASPVQTIQSDIFKPTKYGGKYTVTLIPGDGIGAEVAESVKTIFKADNVPIEWEQIDVSGVENTASGVRTEDLFHESVASLGRNKLGLKGILHTPISRSGPPELQRRHAPGAGHLRLDRPGQEHPRPPDPPQERRHVHHP